MTTTISISTATYGSLLTEIVHADRPRIRDITELFPFQLQQVTFLGGLETFSGDGCRLFLFFLSVHIHGLGIAILGLEPWEIASMAGNAREDTDGVQKRDTF